MAVNFDNPRPQPGDPVTASDERVVRDTLMAMMRGVTPASRTTAGTHFQQAQSRVGFWARIVEQDSGDPALYEVEEVAFSQANEPVPIKSGKGLKARSIDEVENLPEGMLVWCHMLPLVIGDGGSFVLRFIVPDGRLEFPARITGSDGGLHSWVELRPTTGGMEDDPDGRTGTLNARALDGSTAETDEVVFIFDRQGDEGVWHYRFLRMGNSESGAPTYWQRVTVIEDGVVEVPADTIEAEIYAVGAGGGGTAAQNRFTAQGIDWIGLSGAGGGGGAGILVRVPGNMIAGMNLDVEVGDAGSGGTQLDPPTDGGTTTVKMGSTTLLSAGGGRAGNTMTSLIFGGGGAGGAGGDTVSGATPPVSFLRLTGENGQSARGHQINETDKFTQQHVYGGRAGLPFGAAGLGGNGGVSFASTSPSNGLPGVNGAVAFWFRRPV